MRDDLAKIAASTCILITSWIVLYQGSKRASTIYFFELESTTVIFINQVHAFLFPLIVSFALYLVFLGTKRSSEIEKERLTAKEAEKELRASSSFNSRKVSRDISRRASVSYADDAAEQQQRIKRLLSDIEEADIENTVRSHRAKLEENARLHSIEEKSVDGKSGNSSPAIRKVSNSRFLVETVGENDEKNIYSPEAESMTPVTRTREGSKGRTDMLSSRLSSGNNWISTSQRSSRKSSINESQEKNKIVWTCGDDKALEKSDIYSKFGKIDLVSYTLSVLSLRTDNGPRIYIQLDLMDIIAELFAVHLPIWACVSCIHIILLETFSQQLSFYFYYHEEVMMYSSLGVSFLFGLAHELKGNWISNDILAFSSIYVVCSRIQAISYQTAVIFVVGMMIFDLFFLYVIDLLSTVTKESRAPLMITVPRDMIGNKQSLATLDIMVPGIFLNVVLKYSSMYDTNVFIVTFTAVFASLVITMLVGIWRHKTTPAMVLPAISAVLFSIFSANHADDLWKFMIKH